MQAVISKTDLATSTTEDKAHRFRQAISNPHQALAELCRRSLKRFVQEFWQEVSNDELHWNWHMTIICDEIEKVAYRVAAGESNEEYDTLIINVPPGTSNSTLCTVMAPVWCQVKWSWMKFITSSYSAPLSLDHATLSRDLIRSEKFKLLFPNIGIKQDKDTKSHFQLVISTFDPEKERIKINLGGSRLSTSVGGTVTGYHGHILPVDDPLNPEQAASDVELAKANRFCDTTLSTRRTNKKVSTTILIMQRLHQDDPTGHILANPKRNVRHICLPGEIRNFADEVKPPELKEYYEDDLLDPVRMDWVVLKNLEATLGQYGYAGQIGQKPTPPGGGMFQVEFLSRIDRMPSSFDIIQMVRYWDKAGTADGGAFTVGLKMASLKNGKFLICGLKRGQWGSAIREAIIKRTAEADGREVSIRIEQEPGSGGKESAEGTVRNLAGFSVSVERPTGNKEYRADPVSVQVNAGNILVLLGNDEYHELSEELRYCPFGTYWDIIDALSGAFNVLAGKKQVEVIS